MTGFIGKAHLGALAIGVSAGLMGTATSADIVHLDDVIIDGSLCVGLDCVNGESFGFDTLRLKENNLRIRAQDTSTAASFPTNDWQITFNDSANGGFNKFSIDDIDSGRTPFTIEARAPSHALYVDDGGRVGLGTSRPVVELHIPDGDTPTVRLEQNGTSGFTPQTWDMAGNETNFFVRDVTNGSLLPFRIRPSAPSNSIYIDADGDVGMGTSSPDTALHVKRSGASALRFEDSALAAEWEVGLASNDTAKISAVGASGVQFRFTRGGGFVMQPQAAPPVTSVGAGMMYSDSSGALCWHNGAAFVVVAGAGTCS